MDAYSLFGIMHHIVIVMGDTRQSVHVPLYSKIPVTCSNVTGNDFCSGSVIPQGMWLFFFCIQRIES